MSVLNHIYRIPNDTEENRVDLYMIPLQFSTGEYHPLARYPPIYIEEFDEMYPSVAVEIVGDNIALMTRTSLFIFDWKTGRRRMVRRYIPLILLKDPHLPDSNMNVRQAHVSALILYHPIPLSFPTSTRLVLKSGKYPRKQIRFRTDP